MLLHGDCLKLLKEMEDNSVDSIVTDPPAGINFMSKGWDSDKGGRDKWIEWMQEIATECLRVIKPGGHCFVWTIPRTSHWTATAWENAGFNIRDIVAHVFGSGFPKSLDIGKKADQILGNEREVVGVSDNDRPNSQIKGGRAFDKAFNKGQEHETINLTKGTSEWEGWGTALKPAREDWILMRKPIEKGLNIAENVLKWGTGGINIDECRLEVAGRKTGTKNPNAQKGSGNCYQGSDGKKQMEYDTKTQGRFPANLIHDNSEEVRECFPDTKSVPFGKPTCGFHDSLGRERKKRTDGSTGHKDSGNASRFFKSIPQGRFPANLIHDNSEEVRDCFPETKSGSKAGQKGKNMAGFGDGRNESRTIENAYGDSGNASRFFKSIPQGRFPANLIHDGSEEVKACFPETKSGSGNKSKQAKKDKDWLWNIRNNEDNKNWEGDSGNASRFFKSIKYCAKASKSERNAGCEGLEDKQVEGADDNNSYMGVESAGIRKTTTKNHHPTVKPIPLMRYLCKLVTPKGGTVLDPFMGSGSTGCACVLEGFDFIGIEMEKEYITIAEKRINYWKNKEKQIKLKL